MNKWRAIRIFGKSDIRSLLRVIYSKLPYKRVFFKILKVVWHPPERIYQHLSFHGSIRLLIDDSHCYLTLEHRGSISENQLFWAGLDGWYEKTSLRIWLELAKQARLVIDIGANSGIYALTSAKINPRASVIAFEPMPTTFNWLISNIKKNDVKVIAEQIALSDVSGSGILRFNDSKDHYTPSLYEAQHRNSNDGLRIEVSTSRLDDYLIEKSLDHVDLVKVDVERHEPEVLQGMQKCLRSWKPTLLIEVLDNEIGKRIHNELVGLGYIYINIEESTGALRKVDMIGRSDTYNYLIIQEQKLSTLREKLVKLGMVFLDHGSPMKNRTLGVS